MSNVFQCSKISSSFQEDDLLIPVKGWIRIEQYTILAQFNLILIVRDTNNAFNYKFIKHKVNLIFLSLINLLLFYILFIRFSRKL